MMSEEYPGIAIMGMATIPTGDNALRVTESMMSLLRAGGAGDQAIAYAADLISMYATAIAYEQSLYATFFDDPDHEESEIARVIAALHLRPRRPLPHDGLGRRRS